MLPAFSAVSHQIYSIYKENKLSSSSESYHTLESSYVLSSSKNPTTAVLSSMGTGLPLLPKSWHLSINENSKQLISGSQQTSLGTHEEELTGAQSFYFFHFPSFMGMDQTRNRAEVEWWIQLTVFSQAE